MTTQRAGREVRLMFLLMAFLAGCHGAGTPVGDDVQQPPTTTIFDGWRALQAALRASPDHLVARADEVVAAGDPAAIHAFVRDAVATLPPADGSFQDARTRVRWGIRGTLRGGAGTPREKAELLADLYRRAGLTAEVVRGQPDPTVVDPRAMLLRVPDRPFRPAFAEGELAILRQAVGADADPLPVAGDADGSGARALAASLEALLPSDAPAAFAFDSLEVLPLVRVKIGDQWRYANPSVPGLAFGAHGCLAEPVGTSVADPSDAVRVKVEAAHADKPFERFVLVEGTWPAEDVVGRRVSLLFVPPAKPDEVQYLAVRDVSALVPVLRVTGSDLDVPASDALSKVGTPFTRSGDVLDVSGDVVTLGGEALEDPGTDPARLASVQSAQVWASGATFPRISLRVGALDGALQSVPGLGVEAFQVQEDGRAVPFTLRRNLAPSPRVALIFDQSGSIPEAFRGEGARALAEDLAGRLFAQDPATRVRIATVSAGARWASEDWATTVAEASEQAAWLAGEGAINPGSEIWTAAYDAERVGATLILVVTDGDATDEFEPGRHGNTYATGAPIIALGVGPFLQEWLDAVAGMTGGLALSAMEPETAAEAIYAFIEARSVEDYEVAYPAPREGPATREVEVRLDGGRVLASGSYDVPEDPVPGPVLSGLYLTLRIGDREVTRALAGFDADYTAGSVEVPRDALDDVESLLFGRATLLVEGPAPTLSVWLDDLLTERLGLEPLVEALTVGDDDAIREAYGRGFQLTSTRQRYLAGLPTPATTEALTFDTGLRAVLLVETSPLRQPRRRHLDLFPLMRQASVAAEGTTAREETLYATARLALAESLLYPDSTASRLAGKALVRVEAQADLPGVEGPAGEAWKRASKPFRSGWWLLVPSGEAPAAFWAVNKDTWSLMGVLADGTGGGVAEDAQRAMEESDAMLSLLGDLGGLFGLELGGWVLYAKVQVKLWTRATIVLSGGQDPGGSWDPVRDALCGQLADGIGGYVPGYSTYSAFSSLINDLAALLDLTDDGVLPSICG
jgi:hypothetical protein